MKCLVNWIIILLILSSFFLSAGFEKDDMKDNSYYYFTKSRELATTFYPGLDLSAYEETIEYNDKYVVVSYHLPNLMTGGGGPCFFYNTETDELLYSYIQY